MNMRYGKALVIGALCAGALLGGCKNVKKADYDAAVEENTRLRERVASLQDKVAQSNQQVAAAQAEKDRALAEQRQQLMAQMETDRATRSGFEGIPGVSSSYGAGGSVIVAVAGDVLFDSGKADLKSSSKSSLDRVAQVIQSQYAGQTIRVEGYTDSDPIRKSSWRSNEHLSMERALAVEDYLVKHGVPNNQIYSAAFGPANPKGTKKDSRRVEIVILNG